MRVVVAMSGGVDSSVAAALLVEQGHEVIGVHMKLHDVVEGASGHCCGLDDVMDARRVADRLGVPFYVLNLQEAFKAAVMEDFAREYLRGATPNPCVQCNGVLKFDILLKRALALGADALATGHYARTDGTTLRAAVDPAKDQSYFLFPIPAPALRRTLFPLGGMTKPEVRALAERFGLVTAQKPESMEVCFLPEDDHAAFVGRMYPDAEGAGDIVDEAGRVLGRHDAYWEYTIGQRRGLGLSGGPWYVLRVEPETRRVVVGAEERLMSWALRTRGMRWFREPTDELLHARIRHRGALIPCSVDGEVVRFAAPARAVTPGQAVVIYTGDEVLGGGWIRGAEST